MNRVVLLAALLTSLSAPIGAQGFDMASQKKGGPLEVYADQGMEWSQDGKRITARGNAKAIRGRVTITADELSAFYREAAQPDGAQKPAAAAPAATGGDDPVGGDSEIHRLEARGNVTIATPTETATGTAGEYSVDQALMVLVGQPAKLVTPTDTVTASTSLEYYEKSQLAVARGDALVVRRQARDGTPQDKRMRADVITANFVEDKSAPKPKGDQSTGGSLKLKKAKGFGNVVITTEREVVTGDKGEYDVETGIATIVGDVKLTRGENQLNGGYAVVNMNTGISRLFPAAPGAAGPGRVQGLFVPEKKGGDDAGASSGAGATPDTGKPAKEGAR